MNCELMGILVKIDRAKREKSQSMVDSELRDIITKIELGEEWGIQ